MVVDNVFGRVLDKKKLERSATTVFGGNQEILFLTVQVIINLQSIHEFIQSEFILFLLGNGDIAGVRRNAMNLDSNHLWVIKECEDKVGYYEVDLHSSTAQLPRHAMHELLAGKKLLVSFDDNVSTGVILWRPTEPARRKEHWTNKLDVSVFVGP